MKNYAKIWKKETNFKEISYNDFISKYHDISNAYFIQKVDGILGAFIFDPKESSMYTVNKIEIKNIPVINELHNKLKSKGINSAIILGDLVAVKNNKILMFNDTVSIVKTSYKDENKAKLVQYFIYDILYLNDKRVSIGESLKLLSEISKSCKFVHVPRYQKGSIPEFQRLWKETSEMQGFDGVVIKLSNNKTLKVKYKYTVDLAIIGFGNKTMKTWKRNQISYVIPAFMDKQGRFRRSSNVGVGFTNKQRERFFNFAMKHKLEEIKNELFINPIQVIEVEFLESTVKKMPAYVIKKDKVSQVADQLSVSLRHPSFKRFRTDKNINLYDLRLQQIPQFTINENEIIYQYFLKRGYK
ncbi:MAG: ATP-dependent DNA ligase [Candidatus Helarchaeota archaeon]